MMSMGEVAESRGQPSTRRVPSPFGSRLQRAVTGAILFASAPEAASHCAAFEVVRSGSGFWVLEMEKKKESRRAHIADDIRAERQAASAASGAYGPKSGAEPLKAEPPSPCSYTYDEESESEEKEEEPPDALPPLSQWKLAE